ncbi:MAG TPA: type I-E CRISPR-associated protein Cas7/Cse4/CasC [Terriglobia bacterium]|nr:type I-E CRISPR-associated protein Cas7/Cse4/CasC [Terriglobia bacterium]
MFIQIHMLQSMPPGNLNRDNTGQPKKCIFGRVTRARISSQCLKRNIRHSRHFKEAFGDALANRTTYLPRMVADELKNLDSTISDDELQKIKATLASKFKKEKGGRSEEAEDESEGEAETRSDSAPSDGPDETGQLVFFPEPFATEIAKLIADLRTKKSAVYSAWIDGKKKKKAKKDEKDNEDKKGKDDVKAFEHEIFKKSQTLTVDIALFGRMTTSDLVANVEASCQLAHAISTHEAFIESDWFTAMDDKKADFATTQTELAGARFIGSGEQETYFDSAVYYKYLNLDVDALKTHLTWDNEKSAQAAAVLLEAAARVNPTGKQNSFAAHGVPELILVEVSKPKFPISYANAFLRPVEGSDLMAESAKAMETYVDSVAEAFSPPDMRRVLLAINSASVDMAGANRVNTLAALVSSLAELVKKGDAA